MEAHRFIDPAFWTSASPCAPGSSLPDGAEGPLGLIWFQTSGSTGQPKWIGHKRDALLLSAAIVNRHLGVSDEDVWGLCLPIHHVGGFGVVARAFEAGAALAVMNGKWDPQTCWKWLSDEMVCHLSLVPTQLHDLVSHDLRPPQSLRTVVIGGGRLEKELANKARDLGWPILASYGMTEAGSQIATQSIDALNACDSSGALPILPHWKVRTGDDERIEISGESLFSATLLNNSGAWQFHEREGEWYQTGDHGSVTDEGVILHGRMDDMVKILGELVDPAQVEREIGVDGIAIVALPDVRSGSRLVAAAEDGVQGADQIIADYNAKCPSIHRIDKVFHVAKLPRNELGKLQRQALSEILRSI